jgi:hypothetical protein
MNTVAPNFMTGVKLHFAEALLTHGNRFGDVGAR